MEDSLLDLALSEDWSVRVVAASSDEITDEIADMLKDDYDSDVRGALADNPKTPVSILEQMCSSDTDLLVLMTLADNPNTPSAGIVSLYDANPDNVEILWRLSAHPNCPEDIRKRIIHKANKYK